MQRKHANNSKVTTKDSPITVNQPALSQVERLSAIRSLSKKPNLFIVGAGKAGTFALYEYLKKHPNVFMSPVKEPNFFGSDLKFNRRRITKREYENLFEEAQSEKYIGEASVGYLLSKAAASEIKQYEPAAKIVIMVRNPVEIIISRHAQNISVGDEPVRDLERALALENKRKQGRNIPHGAEVNDWLYYKEWAKLTEQIERYMKVFPEENVFIGIYDDMKKDPDKFCESLVQFLGLPRESAIKLERVNTRRYVKSVRLMRVLSGKAPVVSSVGKRLVPNRRVRRVIKEKLGKLNTKDRSHLGYASMALEKRLKSELSREVASLEALLGRDLGHWLQ